MDFDFTFTWHAPETSRAQSVIGSYNLGEVKLEKRIRGSIPVEGLDWKIGVITGLSGSGKTTIAKQFAANFGGDYFAGLPYSKPCFLDDFPAELSNREIEMALNCTGFSLGFLYGEAFSRFEQTIKYSTSWFKKQSAFLQWLVSSLLDANHHFQVGLAVVLVVLTSPLFANNPTWRLILLWLGWGLVASDMRDFRNILRRIGLKQAPTSS